MASFKSHPVFSSLLVILGLAAVGEGCFIYTGYRSRASALAGLKKNQDTLALLHSATPSLTTENAALIKADLDNSTKNLAMMQALLKGKGEAAGQLQAAPVPSDSPSAYFSLNKLVEDYRKKYLDGQIKIKDDERFGFATYAHEGPSSDLIPEVFHEQQVASYLLDALFDAKPSGLLSFQREHPLTKAERHEVDFPPAATGLPPPPAMAPASDSSGDLFTIDPRITARKPGFVDAIAFRLSFTGKTGSLRSFLNKVGTFELPMVVRSVEVEPSDPDPAGQDQPVDKDGNPVDKDGNAMEPLPKAKVEKLLSKFTVTLEYINLVSAAQPPSAPAP